MQNYTLSHIAELLGAELQGDGALEITKIATLANARSHVQPRAVLSARA